jgi:L-fuconolactonase
MLAQRPSAPVKPEGLARIDAHQHCWTLARGDYRWLRADLPALAPIRRDIEPAELQPLLAAHGVVQTVLVQATDSEAETDFLLGLAHRHAFIGGVVGWVDLSRAESVATLECWAGDAAFKGVRPMLQDLPDDDWIAQAPRREVVLALRRLGLRFDALVQSRHLPSLLQFAKAWPDLPIVIDHAAKPQLAAGWSAPWAAQWRSNMAALARCPNVMCKVSGLLTELPAPARRGGAEAAHALQPVWNTLLDYFGPARLIWGSDWPVLNLAADYAQWIAVSQALMSDLAEAEQRAVCHDNATRFYQLTTAPVCRSEVATA